jgi:HEAT repeat protein
MKTAKIKSVLKNTCLAATALIMLAGSIQAQSNNPLDGVKRERAVKSIIFNFNNASAGIRESSIKYAGEYKLTETEDALIDLLKKNEEPSTKILIANSLLMIGDEKGIDAIRTAVSNENDQAVKEVYAKVVSEFEKSKKY